MCIASSAPPSLGRPQRQALEVGALGRLGPEVTFLRREQVVGVDLTFEASEEGGSSGTRPDLSVRREGPAGVGSDPSGEGSLTIAALSSGRPEFVKVIGASGS